MKKILILANNDVGLYKFRKELIQELLKENEVYISLPDGTLVDLLKKMGCKFINTDVDRRGLNPFKDLKLINEYRKIFKKIKPDLIITYTIKPNIYGGILARLKGICYVENITGLGSVFQKDNLLKKMIVFLYRFALKKVKVVFFENKENQNTFINEKIIKEEKTYLLNGAGVNLDEYQFSLYPEQDEVIRFLFIGRIMKEKGIDELLYAAEKIKKEFSNIEFDIVGPMEDDYKFIIEKYSNQHIINYYGFQDDVKPFIERCHCFILPSYHEGMANTLLEAAAMGRPLITSNIHGCKEVIDDNGYVCLVKNSEDLYLKIKKFLQLDIKNKKILGLNSRKRVEAFFDKKKVVKETLKQLV